MALAPAYQKAYESFKQQADVAKQRDLEEESASLARRRVLSSPYASEPLQNIRMQYANLTGSKLAELGLQQATAETEQQRFDTELKEKVRQYNENLAFLKEKEATTTALEKERIKLQERGLENQIKQYEKQLEQQNDQFLLQLGLNREELEVNKQLQKEYNEAVIKGQERQFISSLVNSGITLAGTKVGSAFLSKMGNLAASGVGKLFGSVGSTAISAGAGETAGTATGGSGLLGLAGKGAGLIGKGLGAGLGAGKAAGTFLLTNPIGWAIGAAALLSSEPGKTAVSRGVEDIKRETSNAVESVKDIVSTNVEGLKSSVSDAWETVKSWF